MWDPILGLVRFVASWNSDGGRKGELIQTHCFLSEFGVKIQTGSGVHVDFFLLPTYTELIDDSNPLSSYPAFAALVQASKEFVARYCGAVSVGPHRFSAFKLASTSCGTKLKTEVILKIIDKASPVYRKALFENYSAFNRGPQRSVIFLMMLHDLRHKLWDPQTLTPDECGLLYTKLERSYQTPKVIALYAQQCFGNEHVLPIDNWVAAFLRWPFSYRGGLKIITIVICSLASRVWGKLERLIWVSAQARKVHSSVCKDILWCVRYGAPETKKLRGANPLACKVCEPFIRNACPAFAASADLEISFNSPSTYTSSSAAFDITTSGGNDSDIGQTFRRCESSKFGTDDIYSVNDRPAKFASYPRAKSAFRGLE